MKILHTADWHLGQLFCEKERAEEHQLFLDFLIQVIQEKEIDLLIHAGDVFHSSNPANTSLQQYYCFLKALTQSCCKQAIFTGGNHDSASALNAPQALLKSFNIHVVGGAAECIEDEIIELRDSAGKLLAVTCAVPFLRDRDIRKAVSGERYDEREMRLKEGIIKHYQQLAEKMIPYQEAGIPRLATGHLFAAGGKASDSEKDIHIGSLGMVNAGHFPEIFDYIALGHLHRPQQVGGYEHIRYSGSPIPLSFSEIKDRKQILMIEFKGHEICNIEALAVPLYRRLIRFKGTLENIQKKLADFSMTAEEMTPWAEIQLLLEQYTPDADRQVRLWAEGLNLEILKVSARYPRDDNPSDEENETRVLSEMTPEEVFQKKCVSLNIAEAECRELSGTFQELLALLDAEETQ